MTQFNFCYPTVAISELMLDLCSAGPVVVVDWLKLFSLLTSYQSTGWKVAVLPSSCGT